MEHGYTEDLSEFGFRELEMAAELLSAYTHEKNTTEYLSDGVHIGFNTHSGYVFLTDDCYNVAMMNGEYLEDWFTCPYCGHEGFKEDMEHEPENEECTEYLISIGAKKK